MSELDPTDHARDPGRLVYPVRSRRAGGLSIGINLNPGQQCNWACVYCEVEGLVRGAPDPIDLGELEAQLEGVLAEAAAGRWASPGEDPRASIRDLSIAGDGEPTLSASFEGAVRIVAEARARHGLEGSTKLVTITNGSRALQAPVVRAFEALAGAGGEIWFKLDGGTKAARERINRVAISDDRVVANLVSASRAVPTWVQTMLLAYDGAEPTEDEIDVIVALVRRALDAGASPKGLLAYGLARPSHQPEGHRIASLAPEVLERLGRRLERTGLDVRVFV